MARSSANPFKLSSYSTSGLELSTALNTKATTLERAINGLRGSSSVYVPALGAADETMVDLAADWYHLDEFCGDVANGFFQANQHLLDRPLSPGRMDTLVLTLNDDTIFRLGQVGFADRDEAIAAANRLASDLDRMRDDGYSEDDIKQWLKDAQRGQYDPAFSVTLVESIGVQGMVDVVEMVEGTWPNEELQRPDWGLERILPLATIMTTALDTLPGISTIDRRDLGNAGLPDGERLSQSFVDSLTTEWAGDDLHDDFRLSVLMSQADPPTRVAVELANNRMSPYLPGGANFEPSGNVWLWGTRSGVTTNYAEMLARNDDASAQWLAYDGFYDGRSNMDRSLELYGEYFTDAGDAIARVVENGLTHWDSDQREPLMNAAIDYIGGDKDEITNFHLYDALAAGVESNMDVIAERATAVTGGPSGSDAGQATTIHNTHDFLRELMDDDRAAARVYSATLDFVHDSLHGAGPGERLGYETTRIGAVTSLVTEADINAEVGDAEERAARRQAFLDGFGQVVDSAIGLIPGGSTVRSLGTDALGWGADQLLAQFEDNDSVNDALEDGTHYRKATQDLITMALANHEYAVGDLTSLQVIEAAQLTGAQGDVDFFVDGTNGEKRPIKPLAEMSDSERNAYLRWLSSEQMADRITSERTQVGQAADDIQDVVDGRH